MPLSSTLLSLVAGLLDAHVHCTACTANLPGLLSLPESLVTARATKILEGMLLRGFTTVRDAGGADWGLAQARCLALKHARASLGGTFRCHMLTWRGVWLARLLALRDGTRYGVSVAAQAAMLDALREV